MKATGIVRHVDDLGRIVIPKELRTTFAIHAGDPLEVYVDGDSIVLRKFSVEGDIKQILDNLQRTFLTKTSLITYAQLEALLAKTAEMKAILQTKK